MEYSKVAVRQMKSDIKTLVAEQKSLKPQRKTVHFAGTRTVSPGTAVADHLFNRYELRHMYIAYAIMRGKTLDQVEPNRKTQPNEKAITKILKKYDEQDVCLSGE